MNIHIIYQVMSAERYKRSQQADSQRSIIGEHADCLERGWLPVIMKQLYGLKQQPDFVARANRRLFLFPRRKLLLLCLPQPFTYTMQRYSSRAEDCQQEEEISG